MSTVLAPAKIEFFFSEKLLPPGIIHDLRIIFPRWTIASSSVNEFNIERIHGTRRAILLFGKEGVEIHLVDYKSRRISAKTAISYEKFTNECNTINVFLCNGNVFTQGWTSKNLN